MRGVVFGIALAGCGLGVQGSPAPTTDGGADGAPAVPPPSSTTLPIVPRACVPALISLPFGETSGTSTTDDGIVGGVGQLAQQNGFPVFSTNVPAGAFAPPANTGSIDFGPIGDKDGSRAVDLPMEAARATEARAAFTVTGWINLRKHDAGSGGDRIFTTHIQGSAGGLDLSVDDAGKLLLGVNEYADASGTPQSSHAINDASNAEVANWEFFAVVYDSKTSNPNDGAVGFYFGSGKDAAKLDRSVDYDRGSVIPTTTVRLLSIGNFAVDTARAASGASSRVVRGLVDEIRFFDRALTVDEILCHQKNLR
jgi:hypothetical protein